MKKFFCLLLVSVSFPIFLMAQKSDYEIKGEIIGAPDNAKVYLIKRTSTQNETDSTIVINQKFVLKGSVESPIISVLSLKNSTDALGNKKSDYKTFILHGGKYSLNADSFIKKATFTNSKLNDDYASFIASTFSAEKELALFREKSLTTPLEERKKPEYQASFFNTYKIFQNKIDSLKLNFVSTHPNSYVSLLEVRNRMSVNAEIGEQYFAGLSSELKNTELGKEIQKQ